MRIAFIVDAFPVVSETFIFNQVTGLLGLGHEVIIFAGSEISGNAGPCSLSGDDTAAVTYCHNRKPDSPFSRVCGAVVLFFRNIRKGPLVLARSLNVFKYGREALSLNLFYRAALFLDKGEFDIIHCQFGTNGIIGATMKELGIKGKLVTTFHGYDIRLGRREGGRIYRKLFREGDLFLSISDYSYRHLIGFGAESGKIKYHPVGIELSKFAFRQRSPEDTVNILTVARLAQEKGLDYAIKAVEIVARDHGPGKIRYYIAGGGPRESELKETVRCLGLEDTIFFAGALAHREVIDLYQRAHLYVLSSVEEVLPVTLMEAQATGLPVVSTDVGAIREIVNDGETGFLVPPRDEKALADRINFLARDPSVWGRMGSAGRKIVEDKYDVEKLNHALVGIYKDLLSRNE